jgi:Protein of unknown function (DUF1415)
MKNQLILFLCLAALQQVALAFSRLIPPRLQKSSRAVPSFLSSSRPAPETDPLEELDQARKDNLFQCLLRDLQIEGVPLLECDVDQAHTLQAALWTTMAELSEQENSQKICLVLEGIGVDALRKFADDFLVLKAQQRLMDHLQELQRFSVSLVGKGVGPALIIETTNKTQANPLANFEYEKVNAAQKAFINRMVVGQQLCPYTKNTSTSPQGLEEVNIQPGQIGYRYCGFSEVCHVLSTFWTCICELLSVPDEQLSTVVLSIPGIGGNAKLDEFNHDRFSAVAELISRSLCLFRGNDVFETMHFHPDYNRDLIYPADQPAHGHLPPLGWIRRMLKATGKEDTLSDEEIALSNYQRRSPFTSVVIKRKSYFAALKGSSNDVTDLELVDGQVEKVSGVPAYAKNAIQLADAGEESLREALQAEIALGQ